MSLDNQRNLKLAYRASRRVHDRRRARRRRDERVGAAASSAAPIVDDWRKQLDFTTRIFRARGLHLDDRHVRLDSGGGRALSASIVDLALYVANNHAVLRGEGRSVVLYLPKIQTAEEAALWSDMLDALERHLGLPARRDQGLRARRAARSRVPVDGDSRGARAAFRRLQHRPVGLHQQRRGRGLVERGDRASQHRRDHDDLRLHARLRGPRAPRRQYAGSAGTVRAVAGRHGAEHPGRIAGGRQGGHGAGGGRRRARAARGRQRQVGRPLEDGAHRPARVGEGGTGESARPRVSAARLRRARTRTGCCCSSRRRGRFAARAI